MVQLHHHDELVHAAAVAEGELQDVDGVLHVVVVRADVDEDVVHAPDVLSQPAPEALAAHAVLHEGDAAVFHAGMLYPEGTLLDIHVRVYHRAVELVGLLVLVREDPELVEEGEHALAGLAEAADQRVKAAFHIAEGLAEAVPGDVHKVDGV